MQKGHHCQAYKSVLDGCAYSNYDQLYFFDIPVFIIEGRGMGETSRGL